MYTQIKRMYTMLDCITSLPYSAISVMANFIQTSSGRNPRVFPSLRLSCIHLALMPHYLTKFLIFSLLDSFTPDLGFLSLQAMVLPTLSLLHLLGFLVYPI